jgi:hypothetical protein
MITLKEHATKYNQYKQLADNCKNDIIKILKKHQEFRHIHIYWNNLEFLEDGVKYVGKDNYTEFFKYNELEHLVDTDCPF